MRQRLLALLWGLVAACAAAQTVPPAEPMARDLHEDLQRLTVTVKDLYGREETRQIPLTTFRPAGDGPFPLVVMNHGRAVTDKRALQGRQRFEPLARYLVSKGFAVFVPTRVGYGDSYGDFDPDNTGNCESLRPQAAAQAASDQVLATVAYAKTLPWVDATRWVVMGQSVGGFTTMAVAARHPPGLVAAVNFAGGAGGNPDTRPGNPCSPTALARLWQDQAAGAQVGMLWLYWSNDRYWGADWPRRWAQAWRDGGGQLDFQQLPSAGKDGHQGMNIDMDHWVPLVEAYLAKAGFTQPGLVARPPASGFAQVDEADKVPTTAVGRDNFYRRFLAAPKPRAFAVGAGGAVGFATGDWAPGRALGYCQARRGDPCKLYAVDDDVVWVP
jgi:dienelactone hydrolase